MNHMAALLETRNLNKHFYGIRALEDFNCKIKTGELLGLIGPNGAGKSTLFNVLTGFIAADSGTATFKNQIVTGLPAYRINQEGISRTFQILRLIEQISVMDNVLLAFKNQPGEKIFKVFFRGKRVARSEKENREKAQALLEDAGLEEKADDPAGTLSYGQQKLLSIVCCLASDPDLLMLDEPVSGINPAMIDKIMKIISGLPERGKSVVIIEHNMDVIKDYCKRVIFMDHGRKICEGTPKEVRNNPQVLEAYLD